MDLADLLVLIWPPYVANGLAVLSSLLPTRHPMDFGRTMPDGRRILGDGKTFEGLAIGLALGSTLGWLPNLVRPFLSPLEALALSAAALAGDVAGAFLKRRLCMPRGASAFPLDQLDFLLTALLAFSVYRELPLWAIAVAAAITPAIHRATNYGAYLLGLKREPW